MKAKKATFFLLFSILLALVAAGVVLAGQQYSSSQSETIGISESITYIVSRLGELLAQEFASAIESVAQAVSKAVSEAVGVGEAIVFGRPFAEPVALAEAVSKTLSKLASEAASVGEAAAKTISSARAEALGVLEDLAFGRPVSDSASLAEQAVKDVSKPLGERAGLAEQAVKDVSKPLGERAGLAEAAAYGYAKPPEAVAASEVTEVAGLVAWLHEIVADGFSKSTIIFGIGRVEQGTWQGIDGVAVEFTTTNGWIYPTTAVTGSITVEGRTIHGIAWAELTSNTALTTAVVTARATVDGRAITMTTQVRFVEDSYAFPLSVGWNFISLPLKPTDARIASVLARGLGVAEDKLPELVERVLYYNATTGMWEQFVPGYGGLLRSMRDGRGYMMVMKRPAAFTSYGFIMRMGETPPTYALPAGWSMIGVTSKAPVDADAYLKNVAGKYTSIWGLRPEGWVKVIPNGQDVDDISADDLTPGCGYWIYMREGGVVVP